MLFIKIRILLFFLLGLIFLLCFIFSIIESDDEHLVHFFLGSVIFTLIGFRLKNIYKL